MVAVLADARAFTEPVPAFAQRLCRIPDLLPPASFGQVAEAVGAVLETERSYIPAHKKGGTIAYETLRARAPAVTGFYQGAALRDLVAAIVGARVEPTPPHDQSSCSVLFYDRPGDHIGWHYDHNFYRGRHFTLLLTIENRGHQPDGLSAARLTIRRGKQAVVIATPPNALVVFEGARVRHKVTPVAPGERRVVLSMTFCTDNRHSRLQEVMRRAKDMAYFGPRALWT